MLKKKYFTLVLLSIPFVNIFGQNLTLESPCSHQAIMGRHLQIDSSAYQEYEANEAFTSLFVEKLMENRHSGREEDRESTYVIPVVLHVFHDGDNGKIDMAQAQSGLDILNTDFKGLNADWNTIDPQFDSIKATLDIEFCLATIDPDGNPTSGVNYYDDSLKMLNIGDLFQHAWDNYKYLNIYIPKYTNGSPSLFTAYAYYPNINNTNNNTDGVFYSSVRWGYGTNSELTAGQEWASVGTHELGHWLNLIHTFQGGCLGTNDQVSDTPPTTGGTIELSGCYNNDFSCGVATNGSNYMDYNHDCKKMFTQGQVDRMTAALQLPSRINLWSDANLLATGCAQPSGLDEESPNAGIHLYPNPASTIINFSSRELPSNLKIYDIFGNLVVDHTVTKSLFSLNISFLSKGIYFYQAVFDGYSKRGKFVVN